MIKIFRVGLLALSTTMLTLGGCKKNDKDADFSEAATVQTEDQSLFSAEEDAVSNDVNLAIESEPGLAGRNTGTVICDATIRRDSTATTRGVIITYYDTATCSPNRKRSGVVKISMPRNVKWKDAGAAVTIEYVNLKITRIPANKSVVFNGIKTINNVTGGLLRNLSSQNITHTIMSNGLTASFDNGTARVWKIAKKRDFTFSSGAVITTTGTHTEGGVDKIAVWGTNRMGQDFATRIINPLVVRQDCSFRLVSGKVEHGKLARPITVTYGLDASGNPTTSCPQGNYYLKVEWTNVAGTVQSVIRPY